MSYLLKLAQNSEAENDQIQAAYYYNQIAYQYWNSGMIDSAIFGFNKVLTLNQNINNSNGLKVINTNLGLLYSEKQNNNLSNKHFVEALMYSRQMGKKTDIVNSLINLSNSYFELQNYSEAEVCLIEAKNIAAEINNQILLKNCFFNFSMLYEKLGNSQKANEYFLHYTMLAKRIQEEERNRSMSMVDSAQRKVQIIAAQSQETSRQLEQASEELEKKDNSLRQIEQVSKDQQMKIDLLNVEMRLRNIEIERQRLIRRYYAGIAVLLSLILLLIFYAYVEKKKANKQLNEKNKEILNQKEEILKQAEKLRDLNAMKDKLFSIIAHDLRSPLFSLMALLNMLKSRNIDEQSFRRFIDDLSVNVNHTSLLLENLLTWAKNQMQGTKANILEFDINEVVDQTVEVQCERARQKQVGVVNCINGVNMVLADKVLLDIVVRNLISNAIKYCNEGDLIKLTCSKNSSEYTICIEDSGVGMETKIVKKLFGSEIVSSLGTQSEKGTGLGLILCKEFVEMMNGKIWAESKPGKGSKFYFTLPAATSADVQ